MEYATAQGTLDTLLQTAYTPAEITNSLRRAHMNYTTLQILATANETQIPCEQALADIRVIRFLLERIEELAGIKIE